MSRLHIRREVKFRLETSKAVAALVTPTVIAPPTPVMPIGKKVSFAPFGVILVKPFKFESSLP